MPPTQRQPPAGAGALEDQPIRGAQATTAKKITAINLRVAAGATDATTV